jgi:hypothetical protein
MSCSVVFRSYGAGEEYTKDRKPWVGSGWTQYTIKIRGWKHSEMEEVVDLIYSKDGLRPSLSKPIPYKNPTGVE